MTYKWHKRMIAGNVHYEYQEDLKDRFFDIEVSGNGTVRGYDLRDMPATYYLFTTVKEAKDIFIKSITDVNVLIPFKDKKWYDMSNSFVDIMGRTRKVLDELKKKNDL